MNSKIITLSSIILLAATIPNAFADSFDEETCLSLISIEQIAEITGYDGVIQINSMDSNVEVNKEGIADGCFIGYQNEDTSFALTVVVTASESDRTAQSKYGEMFSMSHQQGFDVIEGYNGPWVHHAFEVHENGIGSFLASIKDNIQVGLNAPSSKIPIKVSELEKVLDIIQPNIDKLDIPKSFTLEKPVEDLYDASTSDGVNVIFDGCKNNDIWWGHLENNDGQRITDGTITLYSQTNQEIGKLGVSKKDGSFGTSTLGQDPSAIVGRIQVDVNNEPPVFVDNPTCNQTIKPNATYEEESKSEIIGGEASSEESGEGGGCLIATATYGSEISPQVQQLRELRDNQLLNTESGTNFMKHFNDAYYSFSPYIADYQRENPVFKEIVKISITPMVSSLSILNHVEMDSEQSVLGYGISLILLNVGMYVGVPVAIVLSIRKI